MHVIAFAKTGQSLTIYGDGFASSNTSDYNITLTGTGCTNLQAAYGESNEGTFTPSSANQTFIVLSGIDMTGCSGTISVSRRSQGGLRRRDCHHEEVITCQAPF